MDSIVKVEWLSPKRPFSCVKGTDFNRETKKITIELDESVSNNQAKEIMDTIWELKKHSSKALNGCTIYL